MEKIPDSAFDEATFVNEIYTLRNQRDTEKRFLVMDMIMDFDKKLKDRVISLYGSTKVLQQVPAWQAMVGGSIEAETTITEAQKYQINLQIRTFIEELKVLVNR